MGTIQMLTQQSDQQISSIKKIDLGVNFNKQVIPQLQQLCHWSFQDIRDAFTAFQRKSQCPFIDSFTFYKMVPFERSTSRIIFEYLAQKQKYISVYELICILVIMAHHTYRRKMQFLYLLFDFKHQKFITFKELMFIFQSSVYGFCRITAQEKPNYQLMNNYKNHYFMKGNQNIMSNPIKLRRLIQEIEGSQIVHDFMNRFQHSEYLNIKEDYCLYSEKAFKKLTSEQVQLIYQTINKVYQSNDYTDIRLTEMNKSIRLENRRIADFKEQIVLDFKQKIVASIRPKTNITQISQLKTARNKGSSINFRITVPTMSRTTSAFFKSPNPEANTNKKHLSIKKTLNNEKQSKDKSIQHYHQNTEGKTKFLYLDGHTISKRQIFQSITYFRTLSNNQSDIRAKQFFKSFEKKAFLKKQLASLFRVIDQNKNGEISFVEYLNVLYPGINQKQIRVILKWYDDYFKIYYADSVGNQSVKLVNRQNFQILPKDTIKRMQQLFQVFDKGLKGYLTFNDLSQPFKDGFTIREIEYIIKQFGNNGRIYLKDFIRMLLPEGWFIQGYNNQQ